MAPESLVTTTTAAVLSLAPHASFGQGRLLEVSYLWDGALKVVVKLEGCDVWSVADSEILDPRYDEVDRDRRVKERIRLGIRRVFEAAYDLSSSPWGILTGVRPSKLVHSLLDRGFSWEQIEGTLLDIYALSREKVDLLVDVAKSQRTFFHPSVNMPVGLYIGIPFCPTRCSYCSFAAYPLASHGHLLKEFLEALKMEIQGVGSLIRELNLEIESIYLGGGTPTSVAGQDLRELLHLIHNELFTTETKEYTVEAGRPETLSLDTLRALKDAGVQRISINPQTMHDETLGAIGRGHTVDDVRTAFALARQIDIPILNMDIILGLPGEQLGHVEETLRSIGTLGPDNLTVHSLAVKRASRLKKSLEEVKIAHTQGEAMVNLAREYALDWGMLPYYLYRQRHILGDLENIGYAKPGLSSIYNVQMMEERQTIIALGGGGITKLVFPDLSLIRQANPKCPATYSREIRESLGEKMDQIRRHLQG